MSAQEFVDATSSLSPNILAKLLIQARDILRYTGNAYFHNDIHEIVKKSHPDLALIIELLRETNNVTQQRIGVIIQNVQKRVGYTPRIHISAPEKMRHALVEIVDDGAEVAAVDQYDDGVKIYGDKGAYHRSWGRDVYRLLQGATQ